MVGSSVCKFAPDISDRATKPRRIGLPYREQLPSPPAIRNVLNVAHASFLAGGGPGFGEGAPSADGISILDIQNRYRAALDAGWRFTLIPGSPVGRTVAGAAACVVATGHGHNLRAGGKSGLHGNTVAANGRRGRTQGKCHRKQTALRLRRRARVKGCGKSAPRGWRQSWQGKPHREQDQIGVAGRVWFAAWRRARFQARYPGWLLEASSNGRPR